MASAQIFDAHTMRLPFFSIYLNAAAMELLANLMQLCIRFLLRMPQGFNVDVTHLQRGLA